MFKRSCVFAVMLLAACGAEVSVPSAGPNPIDIVVDSGDSDASVDSGEVDSGEAGVDSTGPSLAFTMALYDAGEVNLGQTGSTTLTLKNTGDAPSGDLGPIQTTGNSEFTVVAGGTCAEGTPVPASGSCTVAIQFAPSSLGTRTDSLSITTSSNEAVATSLSGLGTNKIKVTINVSSVRGASGTVTSSVPPQPTCVGTVCTAEYDYDTDVTLTATPAGANLVQSWGITPCPNRFSHACPLGKIQGEITTSVTFRPPINYAFVTSTTIKPNTIGKDLLNADRLCDSLARAQGLADTPTNGVDPPYFKALLSTSETSAHSRIDAAQGWIRVDGKEFANKPVDLFNEPGATNPYQMFYPLTLDEKGNSVGSAFVATGSDGQGNYYPDQTCVDYSTSGSGATIQLGAAFAAGDVWLSRQANLGCGADWRLYCFETGQPKTTVEPSIPDSKRITFTSAGSFTGTDGRDVADALCTTEATNAGLSGSFKALLPLTGTTAAARFDTTGANWVRPDGVPIAKSTTSFMDAAWQAPLAQLATGSYALTGFVNTWVGAAKPNGAATAASTCSDWSTSGTAAAYMVSPTSPGDGYQWGSFALCASSKRVLCVQE